MNSLSWKFSKKPRSWQKAALENWVSSYRGVASVVTGGGKTIFAHFCMAEVLKRWPEARFIVVVPTTALLDQWYVSFQEDLGVPESDLATYSGRSKSPEPRRINLMVINTARTWAGKLSAGAESFLIVDECHRAGSEMNSLCLRGDHVATLGLSATPVREYDEGFEELVEPALGPIIFEYSYPEAARDDVICSFELRNIRIDIGAEGEERLQSFIDSKFKEAGGDRLGEQEKKEFYSRLQKRGERTLASGLRVPLAVKLVEMHSGLRTMVFHERTKAASEIASLLTQRGIKAVEYHTGIGDAMRRDNLRLFRRGVFRCLVTCRALDEGANIPETSVAVLARSTRSRRQRIQRLGRVLRPVPGKDSAIIYTLYSTKQEERNLAREAENLEGLAGIKWLKGGI